MVRLRFLLSLLRRQWLLTLAAPLLVLLEVAAELSQPVLMANVVNEGVVAGEIDVFWRVGTVMVAVSVAGVLCGVLSIFCAGKVSYAFGADLRKVLFAKIHSLSFAQIDRLQTGTLITRLTDDAMRVQHLLQASLRLLVRAPLMFIGSVFMVHSLNADVSLVFWIILPVLFSVIFFLLRRAIPLFVAVQACLDKFNMVMLETFSGIRIIKAYLSERKESGRFGKANTDYVRSILKVSKNIVLIMPAVSLLMNVGIVFVLFIGAKEVGAGNMNLGDLMATTGYLSHVLVSLLMASHIFMSFSQSQVSVERIFDVINEAEEQECGGLPFPEKLSVEFKNVSFVHDDVCGDSRSCLDDISFALNEGETLVILGETGSGKSTLVSLVSGFYKKTGGEILIGGVPIEDINKEELNKNIGFAFQDPKVYEGSISENLRLGNNGLTEAEQMSLLSMVCLDSFVSSNLQGLDYRVVRGGQNLSGGQRQRLSIATMLASSPRIMIFDDAFSSLDFNTDEMVRKNLLGIRATKIFVEQRVASVRYADKVMLLKDGRVACFGEHNELMRKCELYRDFCVSQDMEG